MVSTSAIQKRRDMSISSALGPASAVTISGSSPMPQMGQAPGWSCRISGCIGQVQIVPGGASTNRSAAGIRSEENTSELQSLMRISYADFCLKKKKHPRENNRRKNTTSVQTEWIYEHK